MENIIVYGIPNCNSVKKALDWFSLNSIPFTFHDFKKSGISRSTLIKWCKKAGWEMLLNKKGTTWRSVPPELQEKITNKTAAIDLMIERSSIIKRPVVEIKDDLFVGFNESDYKKFFLK